jgi:DNA-binding NtrC family response regulator
MYHGIVLSHDSKTISLCEVVGKELGLKNIYKHNLANFLLSLQENDFHVAVFDCTDINNNNIEWVKVIKKTRPKIPLIVFSSESEQKRGGKMYEEGTFYFCITPVHKEVLRKVLSAAIASYPA